MKEIRKKFSLENLPVIAMTANALADDRRQYDKAGMNGFIAKPVIFEEIDQVIHQWIK
jgi:CheY-like chemotaxis protein